MDVHVCVRAFLIERANVNISFAENAACAKLDAKHGDMYNNLKVNLDHLDTVKKQNIPDYDNISIGLCRAFHFIFIIQY